MRLFRPASLLAALGLAGCAGGGDVTQSVGMDSFVTLGAESEEGATQTGGDEAATMESDTGDGDAGDGDGDGSGGDGDGSGDGDGDGTTDTAGDGTSGDGTSGDGDGTSGDGDGTGGDGDGTTGDGDGTGGDGDGTSGDGDGTSGDGDGSTGDGDGDGDRCQDGILDPGEDCDQAQLGGQDCAGLGFVSGTLTCDSSCNFNTSQCLSCGDGVVDAAEDCDGMTVPDTCAGLGYISGTLACDSACAYDVTMCIGATCGDGVISSPENCDCGGDACTASELAAQGCGDFPPFTAGTLGCGATSCDFDTSGCFYCGDGGVDAGEDCDSGDVGAETCLTVGGGFDGGTLGCDDNSCTFDTSGCRTCGNGMLETGEICDVGQLGSNTCASEGFVDGTLLCDASTCTLDTSGCSRCGNNILDLADGEQCDGTAINDTCAGLGYVSGTLGCASNCQYDVAMCVGATCGDEVISSPEACDCGSNGCVPTELANQTCADFPPFEAGTLLCGSANCQFDLSGCYYCGDGNRDGTEQCDSGNVGGQTCLSIGQGFTGGTLGCDDLNCAYDTSACTVCGDGVAEGAEQCDLMDVGSNTCANNGFQGGTLDCFGNCQLDTSGCDNCGDSIVDTGEGEQCDTLNLNSQDCTTVGGGFASGTLVCDSACRFDTSMCSLCGNGVLDAGEECDGAELDSNDCTTVPGGFAGGTLGCTSSCTFEVGQCNNCGDGLLDAGEQCDCAGVEPPGGACASGDLGAWGTCADATLGLVTELLGCKADCTYDFAQCSGCGDQIVTAPEECEPDDGTGRPDLVGEDCVTQMFDGGSLDCATDCTFDTTGCFECGDLIKNGSEECDGSDFGAVSCLNYLATDGNPFLGGTLSCTAGCLVDTANCERCGDGVITGNEVCDGSDIGLNTCASLLGAAYESGTPVCNATCDGFDTSACTDCGDAIIEGSEECDDPTYNTTCAGLGFVSGTLGCTGTCQHDTSGCVGAVCGDGSIDSPEECDCGGDTCTSGELAGQTCLTVPGGFDSGTLDCSPSNCSFDTTQCYICGDDVSDPTETCDGSDLNGLNCTDFGTFTGGTLGCDPDCGGYDTSNCFEVPPADDPHKMCSTTTPFAIPDGVGANTPGATWQDTITVPQSGTIVDVHVEITGTHSYVGDLEFALTHNAITRTIWSRPADSGAPGSTCRGNDFDVLIADSGSPVVDDAAMCDRTLGAPDYELDGLNIASVCEWSGAVCTDAAGDTDCSGTNEQCATPRQPNQAFATFASGDMTGDWILSTTDYWNGDTGSVISWCVTIDWM